MLFDGLSDGEHARTLFAKDLGHVSFVGQANGRLVCGHSLHRLGAGAFFTTLDALFPVGPGWILIVGTPVKHKSGEHGQSRVERLSP